MLKKTCCLSQSYLKRPEKVRKKSLNTSLDNALEMIDDILTRTQGGGATAPPRAIQQLEDVVTIETIEVVVTIETIEVIVTVETIENNPVAVNEAIETIA